LYENKPEKPKIKYDYSQFEMKNPELIKQKESDDIEGDNQDVILGCVTAAYIC
jgi:hypothetical protein